MRKEDSAFFKESFKPTIMNSFLNYFVDWVHLEVSYEKGFCRTEWLTGSKDLGVNYFITVESSFHLLSLHAQPVSRSIFDRFKLTGFMYLIHLHTAGYSIYRQLQNSEASGSKSNFFFFFRIKPDKLREGIYVGKEDVILFFICAAF